MKRYSIILLISLFTALHAIAQLYPVRTITNVGAPYPLSLEQYGSFDNNRLQLTIIPNDIALQNYPVKLRLVISGGWFKIYTNPSFIHKEILLNNGETMTFTGADLAEWFNPDNLIFEGYSKAQYMKTGRLPEGVYQLWFEAWDLYRDFNISGTTKAMVFTLESEPPILNFPENKKELEPYDPQNIVFNWTFRQSPFSAGGSSHQYRFELWEIDPDDMNAEEAVRIMRPIYTTEVNATTLNYTAAEPLLFKGKRYAWRIQVFDPMGAMRYKNDGYSQVFWFRFGKDIPVPLLSLDKTTTSSISVKWENDYRITKYELRYRNKAKEGANWYTKDASGQSATLDNLEQNTPYEIQLHGYNGSQEGDYSESLTAKTNQDKAFACGAAPGAANTENTEPLSMLKRGDIFRASDFDIEVYKTSGANGSFTGRGFAMIPYLKFVKFEVEFNGIQINKDYRMTNGQVRFIYNEKNGLVANISKIIEDLRSHEPRVVEDNPYTKTADQKIVSNADITEVTVENGVVTAKTSDGRTTQVRGNTSGEMVAVSVGSDDSEQYVADTKNGTVYKGTPEKATSGKKPEQPASKTNGPTQYEVTFLPHILQQGGMDIPTSTSPAANYHQIQVGEKTIQVPWKSVETNKIDRIVAHIAGDPADTVRFLTSEGNLVLSAAGDKAFVSKTIQNPPSSGTFKQLLVTGREKDGEDLKAWYPEYEPVTDSTAKQNRILAGQVNIAAYDKIFLDVCIVEVNGATVPETLPIEKELNEIYAASLVQWKVSRIKDFKVNIEGMQNGIFDNTDPNNNMDYTDHEKQVKEALKDHKDYNRKTLYLFFIGGKTKDNNLKGYMPFNKQFGFIFRDNQQIQELIRTIAHELGHGAFRLRHPFSNKCPYPQTKGQTNNLMDYVDAGKALQALALHKYQWDEVHDFDLGLNWFEDEGEGMSGISITEHILNRLAELKTEFDAEYLAILHCEQCEKEPAAKILKYSDLLPYQELQQLKDLISPKLQLKVTGAPQSYSLNKVETLHLDTKACFALYFKNDNEGIKLDQNLSITKNDLLNNIIAPALYMMDKNNPSKKIDCTDELANGTWSRAICPQENTSNPLDLITEEYLNNLITHLESCIQNQDKGDGSNSNRIHNYTAYTFKNEKFVNDLLNGLNQINDPIAGTRHTSKAHLFITEGNVSEEIIKEINDFKVADGEYKIWINKNIEGYWEYKTPLPENISETFRKINEQSENKYSFNDFVKTLQDQLNNAADALDFIATGIYEGLDWLGNGVRKARIPEYVYNCNDKKNYNPAHAKIYHYFSRIINPVSGILKEVLLPTLIAQIDDPKIKDCLNSLKKDEVEFAIICGFWNGIIETVGTIPDLLKLVITPFTSKGRDNFSKFIDNLKSFVREDEQGKEICSGMWCAIKTGMGDMFDPSKCCQFGEIIGEIAVPIVISFIDPEALAAAVQSAGGKTLLTIIKALKWMDKVADPALYASKVFKSLKMFRFVNQSLSVIRTQSGRLLVKIQNGAFKATVLMNDLIQDISVSMNDVLALTTPDGTSFIIRYSDNGVERTATILGHELLSSLRGVNKAKLAQLIKLVPDQSLFLNRLTKTGLEFESLNTFIDDLIKNADLLDEFNNLNIAGDGIRNIAESWEVLFTTGRSTLRKDPKLLKKLSDIISNNNFGGNGSKWTKEHFSNLFTNHKNRGYAGQVITDDLGVENIVGRTMSAEELFDVLALARQNPKPGMQKVLNDLCCNTDKKYIGSEYVLRYAKDHWSEIVEFEETVQDGARVIDIVSSTKPYRRELKSWRNFANNYKPRFIKEFIEDLKGVQDMDEMGWYFDLKGDLADKAKLKAAVLETLSSKEGKQALESLSKSKRTSLFKNYDDLVGITDNNISQFLDDNFTLIFK